MTGKYPLFFKFFGKNMVILLFFPPFFSKKKPFFSRKVFFLPDKLFFNTIDEYSTISILVTKSGMGIQFLVVFLALSAFDSLPFITNSTQHKMWIKKLFS